VLFIFLLFITDFDSRSQFIRSAIKKLIEEKEISEILEASKMAKLGEIFEGDLDQLVKKCTKIHLTTYHF